MDLQDKTILILGGSGLVGRAVARRLFDFRPARVVLVALTEAEIDEAKAALDPHRGTTEIDGAWGNVFVPESLARLPRAEVLGHPEHRARLAADLLDELSPEILERSYLFQLITEFRPAAVVDCINTATALAYQDIYQSANGLLAAARTDGVSCEQIERHVLTLTMPQLIRHVQILVEATRRVGTQSYVKIGTSGTGGMGLNVPYTHSEERPSRKLLTKSAVAGAHSLMLFLMGRTPGAPAAVEIKPTAAIAWRRIAYGPVRRAGRTLDLWDCAEPMPVASAFTGNGGAWTSLGRPLESVFIDVGENGVFARDEFETVTSLGQMEFITPEEVAEYTVTELRGGSSGRDIVAALDGATAGPTYNAGVLRAAAIERLRALEESHGVRSVAFEMLGPPRLTKLLYESYILSRLRGSVHALAESDAAGLAGEAAALIADQADLRQLIISVGLPILVPGEKVYRGDTVIVQPNGEDLDRVSARGWVDLREPQCERWIGRAARMAEQAAERDAADLGTGSDIDWAAFRGDDPIVPALFAKWVFRYEEDGERIKR